MYHNIAISGGGASALVFVGCVKRIYERKDIFQLHNYVGSSSGSLICLFMILEYTFTEIVCFLKKHLVDSTILEFSPTNVLGVLRNYGFSDGKRITEFIETILLEKNISSDYTFIDLAKKTGRNLIVTVTNISQQKVEYLSVDTYPDMKITTALRMSTSIPILFEPVKFYEDMYVDSLIYNNFPLDVFHKFDLNTFGINVVSEKQKITSISSYISNLLHCIINNTIVKANSENKHVCNILLKGTMVNFNIIKFKFEVNQEALDQYIETGYQQITSFLE